MNLPPESAKFAKIGSQIPNFLGFVGNFSEITDSDPKKFNIFDRKKENFR